MSQPPKTLAEIEEECRGFAAEAADPEVSRILREAADDLAQSQMERDPTKH